MVGRFVDIRGIVYHHCVKLSFLMFLNSIIHVVKIMIVSNRASNITNDMQMYLLRRIPVRGDSQHNTIYVDMYRKKAHGFGKDVKYPIVEIRYAVVSVGVKPAETRYVNIHFAAVRYHRHLFHIYICLHYPRPPPKKGPYRFCVGCLSSRSKKLLKFLK
jgi:hypothetical protein